VQREYKELRENKDAKDMKETRDTTLGKQSSTNVISRLSALEKLYEEFGHKDKDQSSINE